jgi:hexosaminidase
VVSFILFLFSLTTARNVPHSVDSEEMVRRRPPPPPVHELGRNKIIERERQDDIGGVELSDKDGDDNSNMQDLDNSIDDKLISDENTRDQDDLLYIWPPPKTVSDITKKMVAIDPDFSVKVSSPSTILANGIKRYEGLIRNKTVSPLASMECLKPGIRHVVIELESDGEDLDGETSYQYSLMISVKMGVTIHAASPYGALYGLETFSQLVENGCLKYAELQIEDYPRYRHRGLLIDTGRRIVPKKLLLNILDAMSYLKLNVFHWHLTDFCVFSIESKQFPQLTSRLLPGQFYTREDVSEIVEYAKQLGIRVIPEIDIPGHARGLRALGVKGLHFCDRSEREIYNDPGGESISVLKKLISEVSAMFPDKYFHIGCDETKSVDKCSLPSTKLLEIAVAKHVVSLDKIPVAWEEAHLVTKATEVVKELVIQSWSQSRATDIAKSKIMSIESYHRNFYLDLPFVTSNDAWKGKIGFDEDMNYMNKYVLGGEFAMWTDEWCPIKQCFDSQSPKPIAYWMYDQKHDEKFMQSLSGLLWPRGIAAAGNFWNFDPKIQESDMLKKINHQLSVMISRGVMACPVDCKCDYLVQCDKQLRPN